MKVKHIRRKIRYGLIFQLVRFMIFISRLMPRSAWLALCGSLGYGAYYIASDSRKKTLRHLTWAFGHEKNPEQLKQMSREVFVMLGKNAGDILRAYPITKEEELHQFLKVNGVEYLKEAYSRKKGVIFLTAHIGAFELAVTEVAFLGMRPLVVGTPLKDKRLNNLLWAQRSKIGSAAIERGKESIRLLKNLMSGGTMGILIDQDTRVKSVFVDFFGKPCATPVGAAVLALKTGAAVVPTFVHLREDGLQELNFYPEITVNNTGNETEDIFINTQVFSLAIESEIRKYPTQWVWMHERWKTIPGEEIR